MASTVTWKTGTSGDWIRSANWSGSVVPGSKDTAVLTSATNSAAYEVSVAGGESVAVNTVNIAAVAPNGGLIALAISGAMTVGTLEYDLSTLHGSQVTVGSDGSLNINKAITNTTGIGETINLAGGILNLGNKNTDLSSLTVDFDNTPGGVVNFGYKGLNNVSTRIAGFTFGDKIIVANADLTGDTYKYDGTTLTVKNGATKLLSLTLQGLPSMAQFSFSGSSLSAVVCFAEGTHISTADGERRVEDLRIGDFVTTISDRERVARAVKWIGHRSIDLTTHPHPNKVAPIRIQAGTFAERVPHRDLLVSPDHAIFADGKLVCARQLVNDMTISQEANLSAVTYYHIELDTHSILLAENLPAESYLDTGNKGFFSNATEAFILHPDLTDETDCPTRETGSAAPFIWEEADVLPIWEVLAKRAETLGRSRPKREQTIDADIKLDVDGRILRPIKSDNGTLMFVVPSNTASVCLLSRANAPTMIKPWLEDRRTLGVYVRQIRLESPTGGTSHDIPLDHPDLTQGWYDLEQDGLTHRRWTNGRAVVALPVFNEPMLLTVRADSGGIAYIIEAPSLAA